ncbi:MAG: 4-alpha-glucanotransferase [Acidimicrobiales bacterium]
MRRHHRDEQQLHELATLYGVNTSYLGKDGDVHDAEPEVIFSILRALDVPIARPRDAGSALRARKLDIAQRIVEPVIVLGDNQPTEMLVSLPQGVEANTLWLTFEFEDGTTRHDRLAESPSTFHSTIDIENRRFHQFRVQLSKHGVNVPFGYHTLTVEAGTPGRSNTSANALLVCAPHCPRPSRGWGVFMPLHALRTEHDWGVGSYRDLAHLGQWAQAQGASMMGALPLYPTYLDPPIDPSPYRPVSRLAYNEIYIDPESVPEFELSISAREARNATSFRFRLLAARDASSVEYEVVARLRRQILEPMAESLLRTTSRRRQEFDFFLAKHPELVAYGEFRAAVERGGRRDLSPSSPRTGGSRTGDPIAHYHAYCQWVAAQQLSAAATSLPLYADLPVGVHPQGFDPYWSPASFLSGVSGGSPPDLFFAEGQNWAFPPLHPERIRDDRYRYLREVFARAFLHASYVRIDHVMGLQRLYVIPEGYEATQGAYLSYSADELHALVSLEAYRVGASVVGEDLGTLPEGVHERMARDGMLRSWVFEFKSTLDDPLPNPPSDVLAGLSTHDTPRFTSFLWGHDIDESEKLGHITPKEADDKRASRTLYREALFGALDIPVLSEPQLSEAALEGCTAHVSASDALLVLIDLQELAGENEPQNRPGTTTGNWRQRSALTLEELRAAPTIAAELESINKLRRGVA